MKEPDWNSFVDALNAFNESPNSKGESPAVLFRGQRSNISYFPVYSLSEDCQTRYKPKFKVNDGVYRRKLPTGRWLTDEVFIIVKVNPSKKSFVIESTLNAKRYTRSEKHLMLFPDNNPKVYAGMPAKAKSPKGEEDTSSKKVKLATGSNAIPLRKSKRLL